MNYFLLILGGLTYIFGIIPLIFSFRFKQYVKETLKKSLPEYIPKASLILPCKGVDPGFKENIHAILTQDYPDYEAIFVTATDTDPAYQVLKEIIKEGDYNIPIKLVIAGMSSIRGQKINNLLEAIKHVKPETEIFAFVDSDIRPRKDFLRNLVNPLQFDKVGVTTGIRWYLPKHGNLGSMLRSIWAAGAYPLLIDQSHNFAWGGANAIKRETFEKANIINLLDFQSENTNDIITFSFFS